MVQEVILITAAVILGICSLYYLLLRASTNSWIGDVPPGPTAPPLIGCLLTYLKISEMSKEIDKYFLLYGDIFSMPCARQKVIYTHGKQMLIEAASKEIQLDNTTISKFCNIFSCIRFRVRSREITFLQNIWDSSIKQLLKVRDDEAGLITLIADKISEEDDKVCQQNGIIKSPSAKNLIKHSSNDNVIIEDILEDEVIETLRDLILQRPLFWKNCFFEYFGGWRKNKIARSETRQRIEEVEEYLNKCLLILNIQTERRLLLMIYLLVKLSSLQYHTLEKSDLQLGPDISGWRIFHCQEYVEVEKYKIPKRSIIVSKI